MNSIKQNLLGLAPNNRTMNNGTLHFLLTQPPIDVTEFFKLFIIFYHIRKGNPPAKIIGLKFGICCYVIIAPRYNSAANDPKHCLFFFQPPSGLRKRMYVTSNHSIPNDLNDSPSNE